MRKRNEIEYLLGNANAIVGSRYEQKMLFEVLLDIRDLLANPIRVSNSGGGGYVVGVNTTTDLQAHKTE